MSWLVAFLNALPELIKLVKNLEKQRLEQAKANKVKEDIKRINKAFEDQDEQALRDIFNS